MCISPYFYFSLYIYIYIPLSTSIDTHPSTPTPTLNFRGCPLGPKQQSSNAGSPGGGRKADGRWGAGWVK